MGERGRMERKGRGEGVRKGRGLLTDASRGQPEGGRSRARERGLRGGGRGGGGVADQAPPRVGGPLRGGPAPPPFPAPPPRSPTPRFPAFLRPPSKDPASGEVAGELRGAEEARTRERSAAGAGSSPAWPSCQRSARRGQRSPGRR